MKLGSLFDGSGTAPLAAQMCGIEPIWASEIEPYPIRVTKARFPNMTHYGDITKMNGADIEPVDIICGGSPCQDLSIAGKQKGIINGERSHLFFEMVRIIKEMREATGNKYPRYIVWENVPGAMSSNNGEDFYNVIYEYAKIAETAVDVPRPEKRAGKLVWRNAGTIMGNGWPIAWRVVDAQYWGVPQRRRRIYLVVDLGGECAGEILFERKSLSGDHTAGREARQGTAENASGSAEGSGGDGTSLCYILQGNGVDRADTAGCNGRGWRENVCYTLNTIDRPCVVYDARENGAGDIAPTVAMFMGGQGAKSGGIGYSEYVSPTIKSVLSGGNTIPDVVYPVVARTLTARSDSSPCVDKGQNVCVIRKAFKESGLAQYNEGFGTLKASGGCLGCGSETLLVSIGITRKYIVRRLTPLECCRLQGFPDWWEDGVEGSDSARYKMWGNGMALPNMLHVIRKIKENEDGERRKNSDV